MLACGGGLLIRHLPNALSCVRIAGLPVLVQIALLGRRELFFALVIAFQVTDFLDGYLARKLRMQSVLGSKLDIVGDTTNYIAALVGVATFYPELLQGARLVLLAGFTAFYCARFLTAKRLVGEWIHSVPSPAAKVNFYVQSVLALALYADAAIVPALFHVALASGTVESLDYLRRVQQVTTNPVPMGADDQVAGEG